MKKIFTNQVIISQTIITILFLLVVISFSSFNHSNNNKVTVCHIPPGDPDNFHEITISQHALQTHLDHGDKMSCKEVTDSDSESEHF